MTVVAIPTKRIRDWASVHDLFAELLGFRTCRATASHE
jgi:hypothetical protein